MTDSVNWVAFREPRGFIVPEIILWRREWRPKLKILLFSLALFAAQAGSGWTTLFDGKILQGWSTVGI